MKNIKIASLMKRRRTEEEVAIAADLVGREI